MGPEDPLEQQKAACSRLLAWEIPRTEEPGELQSMGSHRRDMTAAELDALPPCPCSGECVLTSVSFCFHPAGQSLCSEQGSSAEAAPEEAERPDLESSDDTDHSSKVRDFHFHIPCLEPPKSHS